jgi:diaminopimelate decarboxylase
MAEKFGPSPIELAEYERAAKEVTSLRKKGIHCHLENHSDGRQSHVDVVRDLESNFFRQGGVATLLANPKRIG